MAEFKQKKIEVEGVEYTLQKMPIREALKLRQRWSSKDTASGVDDIKMAELCLENIVVMPKMKLDDFESIDALEKLIVECVNFQYLGK